MKKLLYKGIEFDDFQLYNGDTGDYGDYNSKSLDRFNSANVYVCPHCIKKYELYKECGVFKEEIESVINNVEYNGTTFGAHHQDIICGVKGCNNPNSYDCMINTEDCKLLETKNKEEKTMTFYIGSENASGMEFNNKEDFLKEISLMIDDCKANGGTQFDIMVTTDASCYYENNN